MNVNVSETNRPSNHPQLHEEHQPDVDDNKTTQAFANLKQSVYTALETYSNVHRGSGINSMVTTHLYEQARDIVLEYLGLDKHQYVVIFCTPRRADLLKARIKVKNAHILSSQDTGLPLGVRALAVKRNSLPAGIPFQPGGGTARLVSPGWVIWSRSPDKFEAGTPNIINIIAFARSLQLIQRFGKDAFRSEFPETLSAKDILYQDELNNYTGRELAAALRQTLIGCTVRVPTIEGDRPYINLDNGASTPTFTPVWNAVWQTWQQPGHVQQAVIEEVRSICARALGASLTDYEVIFTSNTTEAINLVAESLHKDSSQGIRPVVLNTLLEHNSNELPWRALPGVSLIRLPIDDEGFIDLNEMETLLLAYNQQGQHGKQRIQLVAISGASNVLGVFNNLAEISRIVHHYGARLLVDAAQLVAHRTVDVETSGIDYLAFSAHKAYAPFGTGVLLARKGLLNFSPAERALIQASGEENAGGVAALGKALVLLQRIGMEVVQEEEQALTRQAVRGLSQIPGLTMYGIQNLDSPKFSQKGGVIVFRLGDTLANRVAQELSERGGIGVRSGCHCAHLLVKHLLRIPPPQQLLQGLILTLFPKVALPGLTRISLGIENCAEEIDTFINVLGSIARQPPTGIDNPFAPAPQTDIQKQIERFVKNVAAKVYQNS